MRRCYEQARTRRLRQIWVCSRWGAIQICDGERRRLDVRKKGTSIGERSVWSQRRGTNITQKGIEGQRTSAAKGNSLVSRRKGSLGILDSRRRGGGWRRAKGRAARHVPRSLWGGRSRGKRKVILRENRNRGRSMNGRNGKGIILGKEKGETCRDRASLSKMFIEKNYLNSLPEKEGEGGREKAKQLSCCRMRRCPTVCGDTRTEKQKKRFW